MGFLLPKTNNFRAFAFLFLVILCFAGAEAAIAADIEIMKLNDVKVGMKGFGKTVVNGRKIETFEVEILGILSNNKVNENLLINGQSILVKVSGDVIRRAGGIAAGMSGSPVYIDNKLIGGLSSGWIMTDHTVGLVTPIEEMLEIWSYPKMASLPSSEGRSIFHLSAPVKINGQAIEGICEVGCAENMADLDVPEGMAVFQRVAAEMYLDGPLINRNSGALSSNDKGHLILSQMNSENQPILGSMAGTSEVASVTYEPGSAIGIQLARGDINMTTLGTLTHRYGNRVLALAHPFMKKGNVSFLMTGAFIHHSFSSVQMPFKIGVPTEMLGVITQDREKGLAGEIGRFPELVPIQVDVVDKDLQVTRNINYQIVRDPSVFVMVLESTLIQALEGVIDRSGAGTAVMGISLECANSLGESYNFRRENMFYSRSDIIQSLITELSALMEMITESDLEDVMPTRVLLKIEVEKKRRTLSIEKVEVKNSSVSSGGILDVEVTLRPFRDKKLVRKVKIPIPNEIGKESLTLSVFGLNMRVDDGDLTGESRDGRVRDNKSDESVQGDFDSVIRNWASSAKNSDLLFQLTADGDELKKIKLNEKDFEVQPTNFVVTGRVDTTLTLSEE